MMQIVRDIQIVVNENYYNRFRILRLANYELRSQNNGTTLGFLWNFLNPALQILVYWFVFAIGLKQASPQGEYSYLIWMIVGIIPWFYISTALTTTAASIYSYSAVLKRMYIPLAIVPVKSVLSALIGHLWAMLVVLAVIIASGHSLHIYMFQTLYFTMCSVIFLIGYSLLASAITVVFKDFLKIMNSIVRLLFYITPIVWVQDNLPNNLKLILKLNPFSYIIDGYRDSLLYGNNILLHWKQGIYFWGITIILFILGCHIHIKFRKQFVDMI